MKHLSYLGGMGAACVCIASCPVGAEVVIFDNSAAAYVWVANGSAAGTSFDPTLSPQAQASFSTARRLRYSAFGGGPSGSDVAADFILAGASIRVARATSSTVISGPEPGQETTFFPAVNFALGQSVGAGQNYSNSVVDVGYFAASIGREALLGDRPTVGFRVMLDDGLPHYGWIELQRRVGPGQFGPGEPTPILMYQPVRWAYETLPNTPITVVPSPGAMGVIALAGLVAARRRRC